MLTFCKYWMMFSLTLILEPLFHFRRWLKGLEALGPLFPRPALKRLSCWLSLWVDKQGFRNHNLASSRWLRVTTCRTICFWTTRRLVLSFLHYVVNSLLAGSTLPSVNFLYQRFVVVQSLSPVQLFATPLTAAHQVSLSFTISRSLFRLMSIEPAMPSNHLILCWNTIEIENFDEKQAHQLCHSSCVILGIYSFRLSFFICVMKKCLSAKDIVESKQTTS